ncbi:hypothetical protein F5Y19DRAFT_482985 [Xylariaceae sp. FL1651]|nr:hypothetical protein F5Y19DRAFT_482985 [Xylariaceae sp. FL1651]
MSKEKDVVDSTGANKIQTDKDEKPLDRVDDAGDSQAPPQYSKNGTTTHCEDEIIRQLATSAGSDGWICLNGGHASLKTPENAIRPEYDAFLSGQPNIVVAYFAAIKAGSHDVVGGLVEAGLVTTETTHDDGRTPLLAAIEAGRLETVRLLLELGADPNAYGVAERTTRPQMQKIHRTPLQLAAARGNLPVVKLLLETYHADDSLVAPDGELALRLASAHGHREIVAYLPARRGGGVRRWKAKHRVATRRAKRAAKGLYKFSKFFVFDAPKFLAWTVPKEVVVVPAVNGSKWLYLHRAELPRLLAEWLGRVGARIKKLPRGAWDFAKELVEFIWDAGWATIKGLPKALKIALIWLGNGMKTLGKVIGKVLERLFSFLHTALVAIATFLKKITIKNVWEGFVAFIRAMVVEGPKKLWAWVCKFAEVSLDMMEAMWGCMGWLLGALLWAFVGVLIYVPRKLWEILASMGNSARHGVKEVMIWINPKR